MSAATTHNSNTTDNAGVPPAPPEAHQKAGAKRTASHRVSLFALVCVATLACVGCAQRDHDALAKQSDGTESFVYKPNASPAAAPASVPSAKLDAAESFHYVPKTAK
jgi:hypothetical protein